MSRHRQAGKEHRRARRAFGAVVSAAGGRLDSGVRPVCPAGDHVWEVWRAFDDGGMSKWRQCERCGVLDEDAA
jgi:S-formylglutathione hydrolase FrmB